MKQADLAEAFDISRSHLTKIETGADLPGRALMMAIAQYFGVSLDWLSEGRGDARPARALNEEEALLLFAYRRLPTEEAQLHLRLMMQRVRKDDA